MHNTCTAQASNKWDPNKQSHVPLTRAILISQQPVSNNYYKIYFWNLPVQEEVPLTLLDSSIKARDDQNSLTHGWDASEDENKVSGDERPDEEGEQRLNQEQRNVGQAFTGLVKQGHDQRYPLPHYEQNQEKDDLVWLDKSLFLDLEVERDRSISNSEEAQNIRTRTSVLQWGWWRRWQRWGKQFASWWWNRPMEQRIHQRIQLVSLPQSTTTRVQCQLEEQQVIAFKEPNCQ